MFRPRSCMEERMQFMEIKDGHVTLEFDPDEAALLAAACKIASYYADEPGCTLTPNPLDALGHDQAAGIALAGYAAMFEAGMTASVALWNVPVRDNPNLTLSALRVRGQGWRFPQRDVPIPTQEAEKGTVAQ